MIQGYPKFRALLSDGSPAVGYKLQSYLAGSSTPTATYTDQTLGAQNANPVLLDGNGEADVWLDPAVAYKLVLLTDADVVVWTVDAIQTREPGLFTTLNLTGTLTCVAINASGQITSTLATGTAPFVVASTTKVTNLNADKLDGGDWAAPGATIGSTTPPAAVLDTLTVNGLASFLGSAVTQKGNHSQAEQAAAGGASIVSGVISEEITLNTGGTTTDSAADLLPANSIILAAVARVTENITVATNWALGDSAVGTRFASANSGMTAGTTGVGLNQMKGAVAADNAGPTQTAAAKLRITTTGTPGAGKIRVTVFYLAFNPPTS